MTSLATSGAEHGHPHEHGHLDSHGPEHPPGPSDAGSVVLDIGPGVGAAVILTPVAMNGLEIEYRAAGDPWNEKHMAVRERRGGGEIHYAAIFGPLPEGEYEFLVRGCRSREAELAVTVVQASVTNASWPDAG
jgi:hypothetical protein